MKKEIFSVCLLLIMLVAAFVNTHCIRKLTDEISGLIADSIEAAASENWEAAKSNAKLAEKTWVEKTWYTHIVLRHSEIDTVSDALYDYLECIYDRDANASVTAAGKAIYHLDSLYGMEQIRFGSIF